MSERPLCVWCRQRPEADEFRPFCSKRCKMADLSQWLGGRYRVAGPSVVDLDVEVEDEDGIDPGSRRPGSSADSE